MQEKVTVLDTEGTNRAHYGLDEPTGYIEGTFQGDYIVGIIDARGMKQIRRLSAESIRRDA